MTEFESHPTGDGGHAVGPYEQDPTPEVAIPGLPEVPTQIAFPLRAILRTIVQNLVGLLLAWLARNGFEFTDPQAAGYIVDFVTAVVWIVGTAITTWVMTRPAVAALLARTFLSPVPRRAA